MNYKLYKDTVPEYSTLQQILYNRGIPIEKQKEWLNAEWNEIYGWTNLAPNKMEEACNLLYKCIKNNEYILFNVDPDVDGFTSSAIIINYLYDRFPDWSSNHINYILHNGKEHGLKDIIEKIFTDYPNTKLLICPDSSSNDWDEHQALKQKGIDCIILDHHEIGEVELIESSPAIIINVQLEDYPNKALTGAGIAYKFVSAFEDLIIHGDQPIELMDLCALGNIGDMSNYKELETRAIVNVGFKEYYE